MVAMAEGVRGDLAEDRVGALPELGRGHEDARSAFSCQLDLDEGVETALS